MPVALRVLFAPPKVNLRVRIVAGAGPGAVAAEAKRALASWVVLDRYCDNVAQQLLSFFSSQWCDVAFVAIYFRDLKVEETRCMEELQCNIVAVRRSRPKVLRLNLACSTEETRPEPAAPPPQPEPSASGDVEHEMVSVREPAVKTPSCIPDSETPSGSTDDAGASSSVSTSDPGAASPLSASSEAGICISLKKKEEAEDVRASSVPKTDSSSPETEAFDDSTGASSAASSGHGTTTVCVSETDSSPLKRAAANVLSGPDSEASAPTPQAASAAASPSLQPWMADILQRPAASPRPTPTRRRTPTADALLEKIAKLDLLTEISAVRSRSDLNFRGNVRDVVSLSRTPAPGPPPLCSVWPHQQPAHRNVVMLIGFCVEGKRRLLVYEYICNRSLDTHLYGRHKETLGWAARQKIAVGAARGLRYLHEECRVGCIIHRDMRPNNILVTHDFEPLVGDFGLARWQPDGDMGVDTRVIGTFGYLAPEYAQSGQITEKADVYSFGVVLVELVTGRKAVDINRPKGQQFLTEWARPLLEEHAIDELIDPRLEDRFCENEVYCMLHAANLCIRRDPHSRPRMSHVLRILEGDMVVESGGCISAPSSGAGSTRRRMLSDRLHYQEQGSPVRSDSQRVGGVNRSLETTLRSAWDAHVQGLSNRFWYPSAAAADCSQHQR
uniref:Serine/threonine-protein kinase PBS1 n=1 Tax=Aegilops tauschii TaxID=37682 RepID=N1QX99_AEGTA